jgi:hypothetical protein
MMRILSDFHSGKVLEGGGNSEIFNKERESQKRLRKETGDVIKKSSQIHSTQKRREIGCWKGYN